MDCGVIGSGTCTGDTIWGTGIYAADSQDGCTGEGFSANTALIRQIEIRGNCASKCSLGMSKHSLRYPVNNEGLGDRSIIFSDNVKLN